MPYPFKITTCCYCGSRAALVLKGRERHELACASCGAPLHTMKMLRTDALGDRDPLRPSPIRQAMSDPRPKSYARPRKPRQSLSERLMSKVRDAADDLLDDVFDIFD